MDIMAPYDSIALHDSLLSADSMVTAPAVDSIAITPIEAPLDIVEKPYHSQTLGFYVVIFILISFGIFRQFDSSFYSRLFSSFVSTTGSIRYAKAQVGQKSIISYWMNAMFFLVGSLYVYYVIYTLSPSFTIRGWSALMIIFVLLIGLVLVYGVKYIFLKMLGNLFDIEQYVDEYLFNVFLVNKVLAILLIPVIILLMFASAPIAKVVAIASIILVGLALLNRYARSQETMRAMVKLNKFHFFIYLCTSEIIPIAILAKVIMMN